MACVLRETVENILHHDTAGAHLVIISSGEMDQEEQEEVKHLARGTNLQISTMSLTASHLHFYDSLAEISGGYNFLLPPPGRGLRRLHSLNTAFSRILESLDAVEVHTQEVYTSTQVTEGSFTIDETLGRETVFGILVEDEEDHLVRSISLTDSVGTVYGPFTKMSSTFDPVNLKTINYVGRSPPFGDVSIH